MGGVQRFLDALSEYVGVAGALLIIPLLGVVSYEVAMRYGFNAPTIWAFEATTLIYGMHFILSFAYAHKHDTHVAIDVIENRLPPKTRLVLRLIVNCVLFLPTVGLLAIWSVIYASDSWGNLELASTSWAPPLYPFKTIMAIGLILLFGQGIVKLLGDIRALKEFGRDTRENEAIK